MKFFSAHSPGHFSRLFWLFLSLHTLTWTFVPVLIRHALSDDFIEAVIWGQQFSFGYDKNPWLPGFLAHLGILIGGQSGIGIYFIQSVLIAAGFYSVWRLCCQMTGPVYALVSVLMYEGCACYSVDLQGVNDNYILMGLLPLASLFFYRAIHKDRLADWLITGSLIGLAIMGKYDAALYGLAMFCFLLTDTRRMNYLASWKCWSAVTISFLIILPNLFWLFRHDFLPLRYAFVERAGWGEFSWTSQAKHDLAFILTLARTFLPAFVLALFACTRRKNHAVTKNHLLTDMQHCPVSHRDLAFLFWTGPGPALLLIALGFGMGLSLRREWGDTFFFLWGAFLLARFHPPISKKSLSRFVIMVFSLLVIWPVGYVVISLARDTGSFPGREIAQIATKRWHENFHTPLRYVAGDRYLAGYVALHGVDHPAVWMEWNSKVSPWINLKDLRCKGALFIMDSGHSRQQFLTGTVFPSTVRKLFPDLHILPAIKISWTRNHQRRKDLLIVIGLLPPAC
jgi:dolichyl-phosphate-mannose-protein mannosyltransferase